MKFWNRPLLLIGAASALCACSLKFSKSAQGPNTPASLSAATPIDLGRSPVTYQEAASFSPPSFHGHDLLAADCPWFHELKRDVTQDPVDPNSDAMLQRMVQAGGFVAPDISGSWTPPDWGWYTMPFNVVSGNTPLTTLPGTWTYDPSSSGPYLLPPNPVSYEGTKIPSYPVGSLPDSGDHHVFFVVRDEATGGPKELWEYYQLVVNKDATGNLVSISGASYRKFDLVTGETPYADTGATDAAGMPITPLIIRYDEVASGVINHALRVALNNSDIRPKFVWPARSSAGAWNANGIPYGGRIRLKQSWWDANADTVLGKDTQARVIGEAMRKYGLIVADGTSGSNFELNVVSELRWESDIAQRLNKIPVSAFDVVALQSTLQVAGPSSLPVGQSGTWTIGYRNPDEKGPAGGSNLSIYGYDPATKTRLGIVAYAFVTLTPDARSKTNSYTFSTAGTYIIAPYEDYYAGPDGGFVITVGP